MDEQLPQPPLPAEWAGEDGLKGAVRQSAKLIAKVMLAKGFVYGTVLSGTAGEDGPVDGASFVANGNARVLPPQPCLEPMVGVCMYQGEEVLVVGPWLLAFDQLSQHGFLSHEEVQQLKAAAKRVSRDYWRVISRKNEQTMAAWLAVQSSDSAASAERAAKTI